MAFAMPGFATSTEPGERSPTIAPAERETRNRSRSHTRLRRETEQAAAAAAAAAEADARRLIQENVEATQHAHQQHNAESNAQIDTQSLLRMVSPSMMCELKAVSGGVTNDEWFRPILMVLSQSGYV